MFNIVDILSADNLFDNFVKPEASEIIIVDFEGRGRTDGRKFGEVK